MPLKKAGRDAPPTEPGPRGNGEQKHTLYPGRQQAQHQLSKLGEKGAQSKGGTSKIVAASYQQHAPGAPLDRLANSPALERVVSDACPAPASGDERAVAGAKGAKMVRETVAEHQEHSVTKNQNVGINRAPREAGSQQRCVTKLPP